MRRLFGMECRKIARSIIYWLYAAALTILCIQNYDSAAENEIRRAGDPNSVFYIAENDAYAQESAGSAEDMQRAMMLGAAERLLNSYRNNRYEYYPFGYVKEKRLSETEQAAILQALKELTGWNEARINGEEEPPDSEDIQISGGGAYILNPGQGGTYQNGQFITNPEDWEYIENNSGLSDDAEKSEDELTVNVTFSRFKEIIEDVNRRIGRNSYFSWTMLSMYYDGNDMQDAPITGQQHQEFYEKDHVTGAFARYFCDSISLLILCLPAFVLIDLMLKDKRCKIRELIYQRAENSGKIIFARFGAAVCMTMLPICILPVKSFLKILLYCRSIGVAVSLFAFPVYIFGWVFPTVLLVTAIALLMTVLTGNSFAILTTGLLWLFGKPSVDKIAGGNYGLFDLVIRHNTLKGYGRMMENMQTLIANRVLVSAAALLLTGLAAWIYSVRRKGGSAFAAREFSDNRSRQYPHQL